MMIMMMIYVIDVMYILFYDCLWDFMMMIINYDLIDMDIVD